MSVQDAPKTVTLITGDRVIVRGKNLESLSIVRAPGREKVRFTTRRLPDASGRTRHPYVIPGDAVAQTLAANARNAPGTVAKADLPIINGTSVVSAKTEVQQVWSAITGGGAA